MKNYGKHTLLALSCFLFLILASSGAFAACTGAQYSNTTDWLINQTTACSNMEITLNHNLTINFTQSLTFNNVTLLVNGSSMGSHVINVLNSSTFNVTGASNITALDTSKGFSISYQPTSNGYIKDSNIEYLSNVTGTGFSSQGTLTLYNATILNAYDYALVLHAGGTASITYSSFVNPVQGIFVNNTALTFHNNTFSGLPGSGAGVYAVNTTVTSINNTGVNSSNAVVADANATITLQWYANVQVTNSEGGYPVGSATVLFNSSQGTTTSSTTNVNGTFNSPVLLTSFKHNGTGTSYNNYTINVSKGSNSSTFSREISSARTGPNALSLTVYEIYHNASITSHTYTATEPLQGIFVFNLTVNNTGNKWDVITLSDNSSGDWVFSYSNNSINMTNGSSQLVKLRVDVPASAQPGTKYVFNVSASSTGAGGGTSRIASTILNITVNSTSTNLGEKVQNALTWLESNQGGDGSWGGDKTATAWALWAMNYTYGFNYTYLNKTLEYFNASQNPATQWDNTPQTTAMIVYALRKGGQSIASTNNWTGGGITNASAYLLGQVNTSVSIPKTPIILAALYESGVYTASTLNANGNVSDALSWLKQNQNPDGSWSTPSSVSNTAWALIALAEASDTSINKTNAIEWLGNQQDMEGWFGSTSVGDTALSAYAMNLADTATWTVDQDANTSTTNDQYAGSVWRAIQWILDQQESNNGWGDSPASATVTAQGLIASSLYGTVSGNITGQGVASGFKLANTTVTLGSYSTTTDSDGHYTLSVPAGTHALTLTHAQFDSNASVSSITVGSGQNITQHLGMLPSITITANYGSAGLVYESGVTAGNAITVSGNASYAYNSSQKVNGSYAIYSSPSGIGSTSTYYTVTNTTTGYVYKSQSTSSSLSGGTYTVTLRVNDTYGSTGTASDTLSVTAPTTDEDTPVSSGGGGDTGGSVSANYALSITMYDKSITLAQGESKQVNFTAKNNGNRALEDVALSIVGLTNSWYKINVSTSGMTTEDLSIGESVTYNVLFTVPESATAKKYTATWKVKDKDSLAIAEKSFNFTVTQTWTAAKISAIETSIENLKTEYANASAEIKILKAKNVNVTALEAELLKINETIQNAITKFNAGDYTKAQEYVTEAESLIVSLKSSISAAAAPTPPSAAEQAAIKDALKKVSVGKFAIVIVVLIIASFAGFIAWYKLFRIIPMSEVKKDPELFVEGARVEGVVKSVTDTKKGKVFLVADHTDKLHIRYPYYTTVEKGDMIRATGIIKVYRKVPYMDATDLHRVTVKHFEGITKLTPFPKKEEAQKAQLEALAEEIDITGKK